MEILGWLFFIIVVVIAVALALRNANHGYTIGKGMYKSSEDNLSADEHLDPSDYDYYDKDGKLK